MDIVEVDGGGGGRRVERIGAGNNNKSQIRFLLIFVFSSCPRNAETDSGVTKTYLSKNKQQNNANNLQVSTLRPIFN